jgi:type IV pilus assembly protein PilE
MSTHSHGKRTAGFTLVELMITLVIAAILLAVAIPSYRSSVLKSRRTEARSAVLDLAAREERYYSLQNSFTASPLNLGYSSSATATFPMNVGANYYQVSVTAPTAATFNVTATAINSQTADTQCQTFTVTDTGLKTSADGGGADSTTTCWQ